MKQIE